MQTSAVLDAPCEPGVVFAFVAALDRYPAWMPLVHLVESEANTSSTDEPAWSVELRTRVGPFARSKRLRMARTVFEPGRRVVFERRELDGRAHAAWTLTADVRPHDGGSRLEMHLAYGGSLWSGAVLQPILDGEIERGRARLLELLSDEPTR